jgi:hypothetical protein
MPDRHFTFDGYLIADAEIPTNRPRSKTGPRGRLLLFGNERGWTLLTIQHTPIWGERGWTDGCTTACVTTYSDPDELRAEHPSSFWWALVDAAARNGVDLRNPAPALEDE